MTHPRPLGERELALINLYAHCQLGLSPRRFYAKWDVTYENIADICSRSPATGRRWFGSGRNYRAPVFLRLASLSESWTFFWNTARKFQLNFSIYFVLIVEGRKVAVKQTNTHNPFFVNPQRFYQCKLSSDRVSY